MIWIKVQSCWDTTINMERINDHWKSEEFNEFLKEVLQRVTVQGIEKKVLDALGYSGKWGEKNAKIQWDLCNLFLFGRTEDISVLKIYLGDREVSIEWLERTFYKKVENCLNRLPIPLTKVQIKTSQKFQPYELEIVVSFFEKKSELNSLTCIYILEDHGKISKSQLWTGFNNFSTFEKRRIRKCFSRSKLGSARNFSYPTLTKLILKFSKRANQITNVNLIQTIKYFDQKLCLKNK